MELCSFRIHMLSGVVFLVMALLVLSPTGLADASYSFIRCGDCDEARCPELHYCEGQPIKDHCGCCTVCSSSKFQPHVMIAQPPGGVTQIWVDLFFTTAVISYICCTY